MSEHFSLVRMNYSLFNWFLTDRHFGCIHIIAITVFSKHNTLRQQILKSEHLMPWLMIHIYYREWFWGIISILKLPC